MCAQHMLNHSKFNRQCRQGNLYDRFTSTTTFSLKLIKCSLSAHMISKKMMQMAMGMNWMC